MIQQAPDTSAQLLLWLTVAGVGLALIAVLPNIRRAFQATVWRRPALEQKLNSISTNMQLAYYEQLFGVGAFIDGDNNFRQTVWVLPDAYILALTDEHGKALLYSITTRSRWFKPVLFRGHTISLGGESLEVKLGSTSFADLAFNPQGVQANVGAHTANYDELYWYGNPGAYQYYVYSINMAGHPSESWLSSLKPVIDGLYPQGVRVGTFANPQAADNGELQAYLNNEAVVRARASMRVNTITVSQVDPALLQAEAGFGAHEHLVRLLYRASWWQRRRREIENWRMRRQLGMNGGDQGAGEST